MNADTMLQIGQLFRAHGAVVDIIKRRFPNVTTKETTQLAEEIVKAVFKELSEEEAQDASQN